MKNKIIRFFTSAEKQEAFPGWLFFFRINVAIFALVQFFSIQPDFADLYSYKGYVYPDIMDASYDGYSFTFTGLTQFLNRIHIPVGYENLLSICRYTFPVLLIFLAAGFITRFSAITCLLFQLLFMKSIHMYEYGADYFMIISLFYCCIFPVGKIFSIDNRLYKRIRPVADHKRFLNLLRAHLSIAYFFSGFDKVIGITWRNGEAIWKALHSHNYYSLFNLDFLAHTPFFLLGGWLTVIFEMGYCIFMNIKGTRKIWMAGIIGMHLFIAFFMGLFFFSALLIILNLTAYYAPYVKLEIDLKRSPLAA